MNFSFWMIVYIVSLSQGLFLSLALALKKTANHHAKRVLIGLVVVFTGTICMGLVREIAGSAAVRYAVAVGINGEFLLAPLIYLFVQAIFRPSEYPFTKSWLHFMPFLLGTFFWLTVYALPQNSWFADHRQLVFYYVCLKFLYVSVYMAVSFRLLKALLRENRRFVVGRAHMKMDWLKVSLTVIALVALINYTIFFIQSFGYHVPADPDRIGVLIQTLVIYLMSLLVLIRPWILSVVPKTVDDAKWHNQVAALDQYLQEHKPFLDPEIKPAILAEGLGLSQHHLSSIINEGMKTNFYELMNVHRLRYFEKLLQDSKKPVTILELAYQAGFNSKASFYRFFKEVHHMTPKEYLSYLVNSS